MNEDQVDLKRRKFLLTATSIVGGIGALFAAIPFISSWWPSAKARAAGAPVEVDISSLEPGQMATVEWRGKPVWIIRRTREVIAELPKNDAQLRDPQSLVEQQPDYAKNEARSRKPDLLVLVGVCTHLGCIPKYTPQLGSLSPDWPGGFYCPCHGSRYDMAGRVYKGVPAPINLEVPPYSYVNEHKIIIGVDQNNRAEV